MLQNRYTKKISSVADFCNKYVFFKLVCNLADTIMRITSRRNIREVKTNSDFHRTLCLNKVPNSYFDSFK